MKIKPKVGWIGLGVMGASMAGHLINQGCSLVVHSRTRSKADQLIQMGAEWIDSPSEVAAMWIIFFRWSVIRKMWKKFILGIPVFFPTFLREQF